MAADPETPGVSLDALYALADRLAREAAAVALSHMANGRTQRKADNSIVTEADHAVQAHILAGIAAAHPDHAVCAEETVRNPAAHAPQRGARYTWVIDPIDGTRNFAAGFPCFSTSIAVLDGGRPVVAVVHEHNLQHTFGAVTGRGALLNGEPIRCPAELPAGDWLIGVPSSKDPLTVGAVTRWANTPGRVIRNTGSTAVHLGLVASGALEAAFCKQCKVWDVAAGALIVQEAGGRYTGPAGGACIPFDLARDPNDDLPFLAAGAAVHTRLVESIADLMES